MTRRQCSHRSSTPTWTLCQTKAKRVNNYFPQRPSRRCRCHWACTGSKGRCNTGVVCLVAHGMTVTR
eukprot:1857618-Prymnesium_polylepis.1